MKIANRMENLSPSVTMAITALARELKAQGKDILSFSAGEPDFDTPEIIKQAAIKASYRDLRNKCRKDEVFIVWLRCEPSECTSTSVDIRSTNIGSASCEYH